MNIIIHYKYSQYNYNTIILQTISTTIIFILIQLKSIIINISGTITLLPRKRHSDLDKNRYHLFLKTIQGNLPDLQQQIYAEQWHIDSTINAFQWTMLHCASFYGHSHIVEYLLNNGADPNLPNQKGLSPIQLAQQANHQQIVDLIVCHSQTSGIQIQG